MLLVLDKRLQDDQDHYDEDADNDSTDDDLDVNIEALTRRALRRLCGELTLLEEQGKEGEERVLVDLPLVRLELGLGGGREGIMTSKTNPKTVEVGSTTTWSPGSEKVGDCAGSAVGFTSVDSSWVHFVRLIIVCV